jgi:hypothetical protein
MALRNDSPLSCWDTRGEIYTKRSGAERHVNLHQMKMIIIKSIAPKGAYCRSMALKLMLRAALRYFSDSERSELDRCDIPRDIDSLQVHHVSRLRRKHLRSSESPRHNNSSIFFVIILVTSCRSSLTLPRLDPAPVARVSWYSLAVLDMKVSVRDPVN